MEIPTKQETLEGLRSAVAAFKSTKGHQQLGILCVLGDNCLTAASIAFAVGDGHTRNMMLRREHLIYKLLQAKMKKAGML